MKIRIEGTVPELDAAVARLRREFFIQSVSRPYKNRGSELRRVYVEAELTESTDPELTPSYHGKDCLGNGEHPGIECCCDGCEHYLTCFPDWRELAADPFYSESNMAHLRRGIAALDAGQGTEHELIEGEE